MNVLFEVIALLAVAVFSNGIEEQKYEIDRRFMGLPPSSVIIGAPSYPSHLPEAQAILPGHTLLRPSLGMLKSAVKFPHRELEGGSGVYGNEESLGIRYDGKNERVLYTGARRTNTDKISGIVIKHNDVLDRLMESLLRFTGKSERRQQGPVTPKPQSDDGDSGEDDAENINLMKSVEATFDVESQTAMPLKQELFWKSKDLFTHIKIDQHAPEYRDFLPLNIMESDDIDGIRKWWFYHQADHKEITDDDE